MKIAISGKGGVGKTTLAAMLAFSLVNRGFKILAIDADPDANLAQSLGFPGYQDFIPLSEMKNLILERTQNKSEGKGFFKLNPDVHDLVKKISVQYNDIRLIVMGTVKKGGSGCICPASTILKALINYLVFQNKDVLILDMEAGLEHLGRGTSRGVDFLLVVVEPGQRSIKTAIQIRKLANDLGLFRIFIIGNKIRSNQDKFFLLNALALEKFVYLNFIDYDETIIQADKKAISLSEVSKKTKLIINDIAQHLLKIAAKDFY